MKRRYVDVDVAVIGLELGQALGNSWVRKCSARVGETPVNPKG